MRARTPSQWVKMPRTSSQWVKVLASAGMWIAMDVAVVQGAVSSSRPWVASACTMALAVVSSVAALSDRMGSQRRGGGLSARGRDDDDSPAGTAANQWRTLAVVSRRMPRSAGRLWLAEAESLLAEVTATRRGVAVRSYLLSAPRLALMMWAREVQRRAQPGPRRPG
ncbi:MAG: hypothetical protein ACRDP7_21390 [Trebonia sp.]